MRWGLACFFLLSLVSASPASATSIRPPEVEPKADDVAPRLPPELEAAQREHERALREKQWELDRQRRAEEMRRELYGESSFDYLFGEFCFHTMHVRGEGARERGSWNSTTLNLRANYVVGERFDHDWAIYARGSAGLALGGQSTRVAHTRGSDRLDSNRGEALGANLGALAALATQHFHVALGYEAAGHWGSPIAAYSKSTNEILDFGPFVELGAQLDGPVGAFLGTGLTFRWYPELQRAAFNRQARSEAFAIRANLFGEYPKNREEFSTWAGFSHLFVELTYVDTDARHGNEGWGVKLGVVIGEF